MYAFIGILFTASLQASSPPTTVVRALEAYLAVHPVTRPTSNPIEFKVGYTSSRIGNSPSAFRDSGRMLVGTTEKGGIWVGAFPEMKEPQIGELPTSEGQRWFGEQCGPSRVAPFADPGAFLGSLLRQFPLKAVEPPTEGTMEPGDEVLVFHMEAPRPNARLYRFELKAGEARLHLRKDDAPVSLQVVQAYQGRLNPHFGRYTLDRREKWTFQTGIEGIRTRHYQLRLRRQDWNDSMEAELEMAREERP